MAALRASSAQSASARMTRTPPYKSRSQLPQCAPLSIRAPSCWLTFTTAQAAATFGAKAPNPAAPAARWRRDNPCACVTHLPAPLFHLRIYDAVSKRIAALWRAGRWPIGQEAKKDPLYSHEILPSADITRKPVICNAAKTRYGLYHPMAPIWLTAPSFGWASAQWGVCTLRTLHQPTAKRFALSSAFRCPAPEPCLAFGSASGASTLARLGKAPPAPRGKCCACGKKAILNAAPRLRVRQALRVGGGAGRTSLQTLWLVRRHRAAGAARSGALAPESLGLGGRAKRQENAKIIPSGRSLQPYKPSPLPANLPSIYASICSAAPRQHISRGGHA